MPSLAFAPSIAGYSLTQTQSVTKQYTCSTSRSYSFSGTNTARAFLGFPVKTRAQRLPAQNVVTMNLAQNWEKVVLIYAAFVGGGGLMGFIKGNSQKSLISGGVSALVLLFSYFKKQPKVALITSVVLAIVFGMRFMKSKKLMPAGILGAFSIFAAIVFKGASGL